MELRALIRDVPDFPRPGIVFKDITPLLREPDGLADAMDALLDAVDGLEVDVVLAPEARGFLFGPALARALGAGFVPARKAGRLPGATVGAPYALEYGRDTLEVHADGVGAGARVLVHDDLLATGGTARALGELAERGGGEVIGCVFLVELGFLRGRDRLAPWPVRSVVAYDAE